MACYWPRNLHKSSHPPHIVFVTAYKEFAVEAFELEAFDYILKPYNEPRIINLLQKLEHAGKSQPASTGEASGEGSSSHNRTVNLVKGERIIVTPCEQIYYAEADEKLTYVYTRDDRYVMTMTISEFVSRLPAEGFFRCHRSYCVNINKIREIVPWFNSTYLIRLHDLPFEVPVSRSNIKAFPSADAALIVIHSRRSAFHALIDRRELRLAYSGLNFLKAIDRDAS